ncbi:MAG: hypothetical protein CMG00_02730 [Candidatus Marinimicrobia bacterium]|nr:hypothetical protein [Candidatus Neomarinimicrobiota bacterium]|tara:strand:- start:924 stop:3068 length:2145 start_codon:yes stop_codon:yes gene_type:complete
MNLDNLNSEQLKAVKHVGSPILVFAGAGSGKTRVLTYKIAHLIEDIGLPPENILAVTFTNKAANEMKERIHRISSADLSGLNVGTFHSVSATILRKYIKCLDYDNNFTIYDQSDAISVVKKVISEMGLDPKRFDHKYFYYMISNSKNQLISYKQVDKFSGNYVDEKLSEIYKRYQLSLKDSNALDFDDLLIFPLEIFKKEKGILEHYQNLFRYVLIDEYQDTNKPQFEFVKCIASKHQDICVVGDDDQSIYAWRGADISNILEFNKSFKDPFVIKLEQNYRSSKSILDVANSVIKNNVTRAEKSLWTDNEDGKKVSFEPIFNEKSEAQKIVEIIQEKCESKFSLNDIVVLYRTNYQSRQIEDFLRRKSIPYTIIGGVKFYDRKEIKDVLGYLRLINNLKDDVSFLRTINFPARGLGKTTINKILKIKIDSGQDIFTTLKTISSNEVGPKQKKSIQAFIDLIIELKDLSKNKTVYDVAVKLIESIDLEDFYCNQSTSESIDRWENVQELLNSIQEYCDINENCTLSSFLEEVALLTDIDRWNDTDESITLMTVHSSKGLEFPVVFIAGMEEGLFPHSNSLSDLKGIEEERRLFYVAITRAMEELFLFSCDSRMKFGGGYLPCIRSRFIDEIPIELIDNQSSKKDDTFVSHIKNDYNKVEYSFKKNDYVNHKLYGKGRVLSVEGSGDNSKITVVFSASVQKKFIQKYANLVVIGRS